jgi:phage-related protein
MFIAQVYDKNTSKDILLNRNGIATLNRTTKCIIKEKLNGEYELELEYPLDDPKTKYLDKWNEQLGIDGVNSKGMVRNDIQYLIKERIQ